MPVASPEHPPAPQVLVVVPVYNHAATLPLVVKGVLAAHPHVLVVDDGSGDLPAGSPANGPAESSRTPAAGHPLHGLPVRYIRHGENRGKGAAIMTGAAEAKRLGMTHIITIDADGQHDPADIPAFLEAVAQDPLALFVGKRDFAAAKAPATSRFGRSFSNFWYKVHTGMRIGDVQSGFRLYPLVILDAVHCTETRYSFEVEVLVRTSWAGFAVRDLPVRVYYPPGSERVSHFRPFMDNARISLLNTRLTIRCITPVPHKKITFDSEGNVTLLRPMRSLRLLLAANATPANLALGAAVGMALGTLPLIGLHSIAILLATGALRVSKIAGLAVSQLCMPPFVPALCIEAGYYMRHGRFLTEISLRTIGYEALDRIWEWVLGSLVLAPLFALACGSLVWALAKIAQGTLRAENARIGSSPAPGPERGEKTRWSSRSVGSRWQHRFFYHLIRLAGVRPAYAFLVFVVTWYTLRPSIRERSRPYLERRFPGGGFPAMLAHTWKLQWHLGLCLIDRAAAGILGGYTFAGEFRNTLPALTREGNGIIMLAAHTGTWQIAPYFLADNAGVPVSVLLHREAGDIDKQTHEHENKTPPYRELDARDALGSSITLIGLLRHGELACLMGDRTGYPADGAAGVQPDPGVTVSFLGGSISAPCTAYRLASASGAPILFAFSLRTGPQKGRLFMSDPMYVPSGLGKAPEAYRPYAQRFADALEDFSRRHPYQFFNFFNLWEQ